MKSKKKIIIVFVIIIVAVVSAITIFLTTYLHSDVLVNEFLTSGEVVRVEQVDNYYFFDGPGDENAIVFYPGAKVDYKAYAPMLYKLAEDGIDCFLVKMPCNIAFFGANSADAIIDKYNYKNWYMSGHSMGGAVAEMYVAKNTEKISGIILLAAYPTKPIADDDKMLIIYGTNDGVLKMDKYSEGKKYWNSNTIEVVIDGGNHSQFGYYGKQNKDKEATITAEAQQEQVIKNILEFIE